MLENMHDTPYCLEQQLGPHIGASMAVVARQVKYLGTCLIDPYTVFSKGFQFVRFFLQVI